jgi:hypothetical protein
MKINLLIFAIILFSLGCTEITNRPQVIEYSKIKNLDNKNGFREFKFGLSPSQITDGSWTKSVLMKIDNNNIGLALYRKEFITSQMKIGDHKINFISLYFIKNILESIEIEFEPKSSKIFDLLNSAYGSPSKYKKEEISKGVLKLNYLWEGDHVAQRLETVEFDENKMPQLKMLREINIYKYDKTILTIQTLEYDKHYSAMSQEFHENLAKEKKKEKEKNVLDDL